MSKHLTLFQKIKIFRLYLKEQKDGVIVSCAYCGSTSIKFKNQLEYYVHKKKIYLSKYKCNNCSAICNNRQEWFNA